MFNRTAELSPDATAFSCAAPAFSDRQRSEVESRLGCACLPAAIARVVTARVVIALACFALASSSASAVLIAHYQLDESSGTSASDIAGTAQNGVLTNFPGSPTWLPAGGVVNGALRFDGIDDYVQLEGGTTGNAATSLGATQFTLATYFRRLGSDGVVASSGSGGVSVYPLIAKGRGEGDGSNVDANYVFGIRADGVLAADFEATTGSPNNWPVNGTSAVKYAWQHAAVSYDGGTWRLYLNGQLQTTLAVGLTPRFDSIQLAALGAALNSSGTREGAFGGIMDDVRIYNHALTDVEVAGLASGISGRTVKTFRTGENSYLGTRDTYLRSAGATENHGADVTVNADGDDGGGVNQGLIRFEGLIGNGVDQVALGSVIKSATLTLRSTTTGHESPDTFRLHRMLTTWAESDSWNSLVGGISLNDVEALTTSEDASFVPNPTTPFTFSVDVTASVQAWANGAANNGWVLVDTSGTNGYLFISSDGTTVGERPLLTIEYASAVPEPASCGLLAIGCMAMFARSWRSRTKRRSNATR